MPRVTNVLAAGSYGAAGGADSVILDRDQRQATRAIFTTVGNVTVELDFPSPLVLRTGDALVLDDGRLVEVVAEAEPLLEVRDADVGKLARLAWQLGDRHVPVQILPKRLRLARDPATEALLARLGVRAAAIEAPFEPEGGAYRVAPAPAHHHHDHGHAHHHDHDHHDHDHHGHHAHATEPPLSKLKR
jgi:urease accessory protein